MSAAQTVDISPRTGADKVLRLRLTSLAGSDGSDGSGGSAQLELGSPSRGVGGAGHHHPLAWPGLW